jgi:hypothetical protein
LAAPFNALTTLHSKVREFDDSGEYNNAVGLSVGTTNEAAKKFFADAGVSTHQELDAVDQLDRELQTHITSAQARLLDAARDARTGFGALELAIPLLAILAGLLVLLGLERRIAEYR